MYVCVCGKMCVGMCVCLYVCMYVCMSVFTFKLLAYIGSHNQRDCREAYIIIFVHMCEVNFWYSDTDMDEQNYIPDTLKGELSHLDIKVIYAWRMRMACSIPTRSKSSEVDPSYGTNCRNRPFEGRSCFDQSSNRIEFFSRAVSSNSNQ